MVSNLKFGETMGISSPSGPLPTVDTPSMAHNITGENREYVGNPWHVAIHKLGGDGIDLALV